MIRRALLLLLSAALALGAPLAGAASEQPCPNAIEIDADASPCDCGSGDVTSCSIDCGIVPPAPTLVSAFDGAAPLAGSNQGFAATELYFASLTGPPVFQPPR
jgi:hypothetical protein